MENIQENKRKFFTVKDIAFMAIYVDIIVCQEALLSFIPGVNLTHLLIASCFFAMGLPKTLIVVLIYTLIDNFVMGSFISVYTPVVIVMWLVYPLMLFLMDKIFKTKKKRLLPALTTGIHSLIYSWAFVFVFVVVFETPFLTYFIPDIPFEIVLTAFSFISVFLLLPKLTDLIKKILD